MAGKVEVVWEDPPGPVRKVGGALGQVVEALEQLKERPNTWARMAEWEGESGAYAARTRLKKLGYTEWKDGGRYEFEVRKLGKGSGIWARYVVKAP